MGRKIALVVAVLVVGVTSVVLMGGESGGYLLSLIHISEPTRPY